MKILAKQNREIIMINARNTQNENDAEKIILEVPEQYEDFNKKIVFITSDGVVWDIIQNNEYLIKKAITKYKQVDFYIWLTKGEVDFRTQTKTLKFYDNVDASDEITDEEIGRVNTVINILEEEIAKVEDLETEIDGKLEKIDTAIDDVNTAIDEVQNLDLDAEKINKTTTVTLTKKDSTTKTVQIADGISLQFDWQGTYLGVKTEDQQEYTYVNLQGVQGPVGPQGDPFTIKKTYSSIAEMNADFNNMQLGDYVMIASTVEVEDNAKLYTRGESQWIFITDFSGATGIRGETGLTPNIQIGTVTQGSSFNVTRTGTNENPILNFTLVKGEKGGQGVQGVKGDTGNGIVSIIKTSTVGLVDTYTIYYTDGRTETYTVTNGENGEVTQTQFDKLESKVKKMQNNQLTNTATGTTIDLTDSADYYVRKFALKRNTTQKTTTGKNKARIVDIPVENFGGATLKVEKGVIQLNGTTTSSKNKYFDTFNAESGNAVLSVEVSGYTDKTSDNTSIIIQQSDDNISFSTLAEIILTSTSIKTKNVILDSSKYYRIRLYTSIHTYSNTLIKVQLEYGTEKTDYEQFTGGQPSPNPEFPQEIKNVGDSGNINEKIQNANLIDIEELLNQNAENVVKNDDGSYTFTPKTSSYYTGYSTKISVPSKYSYKIKNGTGVNFRLRFVYEDGAITDGQGNGTGSEEVSINNQTSVIHGDVVGIRFNWTTKGTFTIRDFMFNKGATILPYIPHAEQNLSFPMQQNQKLLGYTAEDGIHQEYDTIIYDGSNDENWEKGNNPLAGSVQFYIPKPNNMFTETGSLALTKILCSHFINQEVVNGMRVASYLSFYPTTDLNITTVAEWREWLSSHNLIVQYELATENTQPYSLEQQQAYNQMQELETYKNVTHIYSEDETPADMDLEYVQDTKTVIKNRMDNLETRIEVLESEV